MGMEWMFSRAEKPDPRDAEMLAWSKHLQNGANGESPLHLQSARDAMQLLRLWFEAFVEPGDLYNYAAYLFNGHAEELGSIRFNAKRQSITEYWPKRAYLDLGPSDHI